MVPLRVATRRSVRRSRKREEALAFLAAARGPVDAVELAWRLRVSPRRLRAIMLGDSRSYRVSDSPVVIGLAARVQGRFGPAFVLTLRGRAELDALAGLRASAVPL